VSGIRIRLARPSFNEDEIQAVRRVLESGWVVQGPEVAAFEAEIAELQGVQHCVAVSSGTAALHLCYLALGFGPGDLIFIPSFAWPSAANMALAVGARPILVDVLPGTFNLDPADLRRRIVECKKEALGRPRAVVPVHQFGLAAEMGLILEVAREHALTVIEDAACALGATYKGQPVCGLGAAAILSFHPRKAVSTGEGGAVCTNDGALAEKCRALRNHGQRGSGGERDIDAVGFNYRLTEIQAAIGRVQLRKLPGILSRRAQIASLYATALAGVPGLELPQNLPHHTWQTYMTCITGSTSRSAVTEELARRGVEVGPGSIAAHMMTLYGGDRITRSHPLAVSQSLHERGLALPLHSLMTDSDAAEVCAHLERTLSEIL
jgi:perosamine synthetase